MGQFEAWRLESFEGSLIHILVPGLESFKQWEAGTNSWGSWGSFLSMWSLYIVSPSQQLWKARLLIWWLMDTNVFVPREREPEMEAALSFMT